MMLRMPRALEMKARGVGTQVWKVEERWVRKGETGVQCSGRLDVVKESWGDIVGMASVRGLMCASILLFCPPPSQECCGQCLNAMRK